MGEKVELLAMLQISLVTADEFEAFIALPEHRERNYDLIDGVIVEKALPTDEHATIS